MRENFEVENVPSVTNPHCNECLQYMKKKAHITEGKQQPTVQTVARLSALPQTSPIHNIK